MIELYDNETGELVGEITGAQLQFLIDEMEETSDSDRDYRLHPATLELLERAGAEDELLEILSVAFGDRESVEIRWERGGDGEL